LASAARFRRRRFRRRNNNHKPGWLLLLLGLGGLLVVGAVAVVVAGFVVYNVYSGGLLPPDQVLAQQSSGGAKIYDRNGRLLYEFVDDLSGLRDPVPLSEVSPWLIDATIATEDADFYSNPGVNIKGLIRAAYENFLPGKLGFLKGSGGSSITQQLVKNVYIPEEERSERSIPRKLKETVYALELTRRYSKDQILQWYLNQISYGGLYYGVEAASEGYFGKSAHDLTLAEAALLAGIPASPARYDPVNNPEAAVERRNQVLDLMLRRGKISLLEAYAAKLEPLKLAPQRFPIEAPHFVLDYVQPQLEKLLGREALYRGGLSVTTTLDLDLQKQAEAALEKWISEYEATSNGHNGALVAIDPNTGEILTYVGSRDYFRDDIQGRNDMALAENSPGSAFKPFTYITAFMQLGWGPGTMILDTPISYPNPDGTMFTPRNPAGDFKGPITIREALGASLNVPAFKVAIAAGVENIVTTAKRMGITTLTGSYGPSITIGGVDVNVLDMTYGYSVFANNGVMKGMPSILNLPEGNRPLDPIAILKVENSKGEVVYEPERQEERVAPAEYAYLVTNILSDPQAQCATFGCGGLNIGRTAAIKTGTSEPYENSHAIGDTWALGYTPDLAAGVWAGNADNSPMVNILSTSISWHALRDFMQAALAGVPDRGFERPDGVVTATVCVPSGKLPSKYCGKTTQDIFAADSLPKEEDDWWQPIKVDSRNGLLATSRTPSKYVEERVFIVLPQELQGMSRDQAEEWAKALGVPLAPTDESPLGPDTTQQQPGVSIDWPPADATVMGLITVKGSTDAPAFISYRLEYGEGSRPQAWTVIKRSDQPVIDGTLGLLDTSQLAPGVYTIRLVVQDRQRAYLTDTVSVRVGSSATPTPAGEEAEPTPSATPTPTPLFFHMTP
jgi:membrane peptidoglycan carboxypeptidase